jgi:hypothetical protein
MFEGKESQVVRWETGSSPPSSTGTEFLSKTDAAPDQINGSKLAGANPSEDRVVFRIKSLAYSLPFFRFFFLTPFPQASLGTM